MTLFVPYILSFFIGALVNTLCLRRVSGENPFFYFFLSIGVGLGISSILTFFSFIACNEFNPWVMMFFHLLSMAILLFVNFKFKTFSGVSIKASTHFEKYDVFILLFFFLMTVVVYIIAQENPFGQWDGWALWNMKARFLTFSGNSWQDVCRQLHWHTQPDYPLLLPFMNIWGWVLSPGSPRAPFLTSIIFTISCGGILFSGLARFINKKLAFLAMCFLFSLFFYFPFGTNQYADIVLAYYLLATAITLVLALQERSPGSFFLFGILGGLMAFTKNEGLIIFFLLLSSAILHTLFEKPENRLSRSTIFAYTALGFLLIGVFVLYFKLSLTPVNRDIAVSNIFHSPSYFNFEGCYLIMSEFFHMFSTHWLPLGLVVLFAIIFNAKKFFQREAKILTIFLLCYLLVVFLVYLTTVNFSLSWRLSRTASRIIFYLSPFILFLVFFVIGSKEDHPPKKSLL